MSRDKQSAEGWEMVDGAYEKVLGDIVASNGQGFEAQLDLYTQYIKSLEGEAQDRENKVELLEPALFDLPEGKTFLEARDRFLRNLVDAYFRGAQSKENLVSYLDRVNLCGKEKKLELECYFNSLSNHASINLLESKVVSLRTMFEEGERKIPEDSLQFIDDAIGSIRKVKKRYRDDLATMLNDTVAVVQKLEKHMVKDCPFIGAYFFSNSSERASVRGFNHDDIAGFCFTKFLTAWDDSKPQLHGLQAMMEPIVGKSRQYIQLTGDWGDIENILFEGQAKEYTEEYTDRIALPYTHAEFKESISKDVAERGVFFLGEGATAEQLESVKKDYLEHSVFSDKNFGVELTIQSKRKQGDEDGRGLLQWMGLGVGLGMGAPISKVVRVHDLQFDEMETGRIVSKHSCYLTTEGNPAGISWVQDTRDSSSLIVAQAHYQEGVRERDKRRTTILFPVHCLKVDPARFQALLLRFPSVKRVDYECLAAVDLRFIGEINLQEAFRQSAQAFCTDPGQLRLRDNYYVKHDFAASVPHEPTEAGGGAVSPSLSP